MIGGGTRITSDGMALRVCPVECSINIRWMTWLQTDCLGLQSPKLKILRERRAWRMGRWPGMLLW